MPDRTEILLQNRMLLRAMVLLLIVTILLLTGSIVMLFNRTNPDPGTGRAVLCIHAITEDPDNAAIRALCTDSTP